MRIAVLVSGSGTILEAILGEGIEVAAVLSDRPCRGLEVAAAAGIEAVLVDRGQFGGFSPSFDRAAYTAAVTKQAATLWPGQAAASAAAGGGQAGMDAAYQFVQQAKANGQTK